MQPITVDRFYSAGVAAFKSGHTVRQCQETLDNNKALRSDEYDSFWQGYWDAKG